MTVPKEFLEELQAVFSKHGYAPLATVRLYKISEENEFKPETLRVEYQLDNTNFWGFERGEFLRVDCDKIEREAQAFKSDVKLAIQDKETSFKNPVKSMVDGKQYTNRKSWDDHLKAHNCTEVGNDPAALRVNKEIRGDFNISKEYREAVQEVRQKNGLS